MLSSPKTLHSSLNNNHSDQSNGGEDVGRRRGRHSKTVHAKEYSGHELVLVLHVVLSACPLNTCYMAAGHVDVRTRKARRTGEHSNHICWMMLRPTRSLRRKSGRCSGLLNLCPRYVLHGSRQSGCMDEKGMLQGKAQQSHLVNDVCSRANKECIDTHSSHWLI